MRTVLVDDYPELSFVAWNRARREVTEAEAFALYESSRAWVEPARMNDRERAFFEHLVRVYGGGTFLG